MPEAPALRKSAQLILVISPDWNSTQGTLFLCERSKPGQPWKTVDNFKVSLGKQGLAWGRGLHSGTPAAPAVKREGDMRAPAGIFSLGTSFGYAAREKGAYPYLQSNADTFAVDDARSEFYNQIVQRSEISQPDWQSAEAMLRPDGLYRLGLVANHNFPNPQPGAGSCIFLHIWRGYGIPTSGCTAMPAAKMQKVLQWLRADAKPLLVQLPREEYLRRREQWDLPEVPMHDWLLPAIFGLVAAMGMIGTFCRFRTRKFALQPAKRKSWRTMFS